jgi:hypothetical protein
LAAQVDIPPEDEFKAAFEEANGAPWAVSLAPPLSLTDIVIGPPGVDMEHRGEGSLDG